MNIPPTRVEGDEREASESFWSRAGLQKAEAEKFHRRVLQKPNHRWMEKRKDDPSQRGPYKPLAGPHRRVEQRRDDVEPAEQISDRPVAGLLCLSNMAPEETAAGLRLHRLVPWFDPEGAAVVTILLGLFQVLLSASTAHTDHNLPKLFILPLILGILIVAGGSFTIANEKSPSRLLLRGCACSNLLGLLGSLLGLCLYSFTLSLKQDLEPCSSNAGSSYYGGSLHCPPEKLAEYSWSITLLLLLYDSGAVIMHGLLSIAAIKTLKKD